MDAIASNNYEEILVLLETYEYTEKQIKDMLIPKIDSYKSIFNKKPERVIELKTMDEVYQIAKDSPEKFKHKYKVKVKKDEKILYYVGYPVLSINWYFYRKHLEHVDNTGLYMQYDKIMGDYKLMAEANNMLKRLGPKITNWYQYVDIQTLFGWRQQPSGKPIWDKILGWVSEKFIPTYNGSNKTFDQKFREKVRIVLRSGSKKNNRMDISPEKFCVDVTQTGTKGSALDETKETFGYEYGDEKIKTKKNKYAKSLYYSVKKKIEILFRKGERKANTTVKMEFHPKVRTIINADYTLTLQMRYIDTWLEEYIKGNSTSTLWQTKEQTKEMWEKMIESIGTWAVPIDQGAFDAHVSSEMVNIMLEEIYNLMEEEGFGENKDDMLKCMEAIIFGINHTKIFYASLDKEWSCRWNNGILSGWQWTAFLDTLANVAEGMMAHDIMREHGIDDPGLLFYAQGDDQLKNFSTIRSCLAYWAAFSTMGFDINIAKNFFSNEHNEFLRKYSVEGELNGYPARMLNGLLWQYPGDLFDKKPLSRLTSMKDNWIKFAQRIKKPWNYIKQYFLQDARGAKIEKELVRTIMHMHPVYGGFGLEYPINNKRIMIIPGEYKIKLTPVRDSGYNDFKGQFGLYQERELEAWVKSVVDIPEFIKLKTGGEKEVKSEDELTIQENNEIIAPMAYAIASTKSVNRPKISSEYSFSTIFSTNQTLIEKAFPTIGNLYEFNAPKSWVNDFAAGRLKTITPVVENKSQEMAALYWHGYENSIYYAMLKKATRKKQKWIALQLYAYENFDSVLKQNIHYKNYKMY